MASARPTKRFRCRGAGTGVARFAGSSDSRGPPECGARYATDRKNGSVRDGEPLHRVDRLGRVDVGLVVARGRPVVDELAVLVQRVVVEAVRARVDGAEPLVPARRNLRRPLPPVAVQVLADVHRVVPGELQPGGQRVRVRRRELLVATLRQRVPHHGVVVAVLPGEERRSRGAAERERDVVVGERRALLRAEHGVHVRHHAHRLDRLVVGHHDDDVRPRLGRLGGRAARCGCEAGEERNADDRPEREGRVSSPTSYPLGAHRR